MAVVLEITVRLLPKPEEMRVVMAAFDDVTKAGLIGNIILDWNHSGRAWNDGRSCGRCCRGFREGWLSLDAEACYCVKSMGLLARSCR